MLVSQLDKDVCREALEPKTVHALHQVIAFILCHERTSEHVVDGCHSVGREKCWLHVAQQGKSGTEKDLPSNFANEK